MSKTKRTWFIVGIVFFGMMALAGFNAASQAPEHADTPANLALGWICLAVCVLLAALLVWRSIQGKKRVQQDFQKDMDLLNEMTSLIDIGEIDGIPTRPGEICHFVCPARVLVMKNQVVGHTGGYSGVSVRVAKGVTLHSGGSRGRSVRGDVPYIYPGTLLITSQRIIMTGEKGFDFPVSRLTSVAPYNGNTGLTLQFGRSTITLLTEKPYFAIRHIELVLSHAPILNIDEPETETLPDVESPNDMFSVRFERIDTDENVPSATGADLNYLDASALRFWSKKQTDFEIPPYYSETAFGRNAGTALQRLLDGGYLTTGDFEKRLSLKTIPELKAILAEKELKVSGKKGELVHRLIENVPPYELEELFPVNAYVLTEKGRQALEPYSILEDNDSHALGFSYYRLMQAKNQTPDEENNVIFTRLLSEDLQKAYQTKNQTDAQMTLTKMGRFMEEVGEVQLALDSYILMFFIWAMDVHDGKIPYSNGQNYYMAINLDRCGKICGYSIEQLTDLMRKNIHKSHPFGLDSDENIEFTIKLFKDSLHIK